MFFTEHTFILIIVSLVIFLILIILLVSYFEERSKKKIYYCLKTNIEAFAFAGSAYYLNINQSDEPIVYLVISLALIGMIKFIDAIISLYDYLFNE